MRVGRVVVALALGLVLVAFVVPGLADRPIVVSSALTPAPLSPTTPPATPTPVPTLLPNPTPSPVGWTAVGLDGGGVEGTVGLDGSFAPIPTGPSVNLWLKEDPSADPSANLADDQTSIVAAPEPGVVGQSLRDGHLPLVTSRWSVEAANLSWTIFARSTGTNPIVLGPGDDPVGIEDVTLDGGTSGGNWTLYVLVLPDNPTGAAPIHDAAIDGKEIAVDGALFLKANRLPDESGALDLARVDPFDALAATKARPSSLQSVDGRGSAYLGYRVSLGPGEQFHLTLVAPLRALGADSNADLAALDPEASADAVATAWANRLDRVEVHLPDQQVEDAFDASLAYMLMARGPNTLFSGPTSERAVWVRDVAYIGDALASTGYGDAVAPVLQLLLSSQLPSGRQPPIVEANGDPRLPLKTEWDAPGELIATMVTYAQLTGDDAFLRENYPRLRLAAAFLRSQLQASRSPELRGTPEYGILPAGESAEDIYSPEWHHYWDDFWALAGFQEGATAASELGHPDDAAWMNEQEGLLRTDLIASIRQVAPKSDEPFIPNGPEDTHSTAMSRSGTPSVWPYLVLDPRSTLVRHSFDVYYTWTVQPYGGAYNHYGSNDWPYAGLSLAHAFYRLGMVDRTWQMLQWALDHQTAPGLYSWCESVDPQQFAYRSGDCPHSWMAAEIVLLVRDVLVREDGTRLHLGPYPADWLPPGGAVVAKRFPTRFGSVSYTLRRAADGRSLDLTLSGSSGPDGYVVSLPASLPLRAVTADGHPVPLVNPTEVRLPPGTRQATFVLKHG